MKLGRLRSMTADEVWCRGRQQAWRWLDVVHPMFAPTGEPRRRWLKGETAIDPTALRHQFLESAPHRFFGGADDLDALAESASAESAASIVAEADRIVAGRFSVLNYRNVDFGDPIDWHLDPLSGRRAPRRHWSRIDPLDSTTVGDSKVIWEINRHQWMVTLAQAARLTGNNRYVDVIFERLQQWSAANPYPIGINWSSSLEVALRLIAWTWTLMLIRDSPGMSAGRFARWRTLACAHAAHVERYLSHYYSPNTHLTGEALGLVYAGVVFAEHGDAARWRDIGCSILVRELARQVEPDGTHFERATCYQRYTVDIYLHLCALSMRNRMRLPADVRDRTKRMVQYLMALLDCQGQMPNVGDADGGWLLPLVPRASTDCRGTLALAAVLFDEPEFAWAAGGPQDELLWLLGPEGLRAFPTGRLGPPAASRSQIFEAGGMAVMGDGWHRDAHRMMVDVGPLGCPVSSAHGHADLLSVQCVAFGEPFIVDAGTYCYTADTTLRNHFRGTRAHNTVTIDGRDQAEPGGPFSWRSRPVLTLRAWETTPLYDLVDACHDGYSRLREGVEHRRRVIFVKPHGWVIVDDVTGTGRHDVEVRYQFSPRRVQAHGHWVRADGRGGRAVWLGVFSAAAGRLDVREGQREPFDGWISTGYGTMEPAPVAVWQANTVCPIRVVTVILPAASMQDAPPALDIGRAPDDDVRAVQLPGGSLVRIDHESLYLERPLGRELIA